MLARVPEQDAGTAGATIGTAQRLGSAIGIAVIGVVLFGNLDSWPGPKAVASAFSHASQLVLLVDVAFILVALFLVMALPRQIPSPRENTATSNRLADPRHHGQWKGWVHSQHHAGKSQ